MEAAIHNRPGRSEASGDDVPGGSASFICMVTEILNDCLKGKGGIILGCVAALEDELKFPGVFLEQREVALGSTHIAGQDDPVPFVVHRCWISLPEYAVNEWVDFRL